MLARRAVLGTLALALCGGCAASDSGPSSANQTTPDDIKFSTTDTTRSPGVPGEEPTDDGETQPPGTERPTETSGSPDFDLREANVLAVEVEARNDGHRFAVTLRHNDDDEDGYANWWVVEALDGTELGRRDLLHAHGNEPFTRSATVDLRGESCVVVRGHDQTHGYGGRAAVVAVETGDVRFVDQGAERRAIMAGTCP
jgi:hypothetical protein